MSALHDLSSDAKAIIAAHFGFGGLKTTLTFQTPWNVTSRAQTALDEAVSAGLMTRSVGDEGLYAHTYRVTQNVSSLRKWMDANRDAGAFGMMVPDDQRSERPPASWPVPHGFKRHPK